VIAAPEPLSPGRLLAGLVARGWVSPAEAIDGVVTLEDVSRSNPVTAVAVNGEPRLVAKQRGIRVDEVDPLTAESNAYRWLAVAGLGSIGPRPLSSPGDTTLVLEAIPHPVTLHTLVVTASSHAAAAYEALGSALGRLHVATGAPAPSDLGLVPRRPWILDLATRGLPPVVPETEVVTATRDSVLGRDPLSALLSDLGERWTTGAVIHGDLKFDNVLVTLPGGQGHGDQSAGPIRAWLIDWELAGCGEPAWDLAGVVEGTLTAHMLSTGRVAVPASAALVAAAIDAYERVAPAVEPSLLLRWTAARIAQVSLQLAAMAGSEPDAGERAGEMADLAISIAEEPLAWGRFVGLPVAATA
jgi:hypothetical protein